MSAAASPARSSRPAPKQVDLLESVRRTGVIEVATPVLPPSEAQLFVLVVAAGSRRPLEGVHMVIYETGVARASRSVRDHTGDLTHSPKSNDEGRAIFDLPVGRPLRLSFLGTEPILIAPLVRGEERHLVVPLPTAAVVTVTGVVVDQETLLPVRAAELRMHRAAIGGPRAWSAADAPVAITDDLGRFTLTRPEAERTTLQVDAVGYGPATLLLKSHGIARERTIHLAREATLEVAVVGVKDAAARVARVTCSVGELAAAGEFLAGPAIEWLAHVGPDGIARVEHLPAGATLTLELIEDEVVRRRHTRPLRLAPGERARVELDLDRGLALTGVLATTGGVPVAAQELWLVPAGMRGPMNLASRHVLRSVHARATTDASGTYRIEDVPAGEWVLGPAPPLAPRDAALAPIGHWFRAPRNARTLTLDLVAMPGTYLEGEVVDEDGEPAPHVPLTYRTVFEDGSVHARADEAGRFRLGPLGPGPYEVTALADRARGHAGSAPTLAANARDPLQLVVHAGVDLHVSGVREDDGRLAPLVHAFVTRVGKTPALVATHRSSYGETTLTLGPVEAGQVAVAVATRDGWCGVLEDVDIRAGETAPERLITLRPGARLELRHRGLRTLRVRVLAGPVVVESATLEPGAVQTLTLPEGKVVVEVEDGTGEIERHRLRLLPNGEMTLALPR